MPEGNGYLADFDEFVGFFVRLTVYSVTWYK